MNETLEKLPYKAYYIFARAKNAVIDSLIKTLNKHRNLDLFHIKLVSLTKEEKEAFFKKFTSRVVKDFCRDTIGGALEEDDVINRHG
jgi:uncharacterized membrane protein